MKYYAIILIAFIATISVKAQKIDAASLHNLSQADREKADSYLTKAHAAKKSAMILSLGGAAIGAIGVGLTVAGYAQGSGQFFGGAFVLLSGITCAIVSIPFFVKTHVYRNKARAIIFADKGIAIAPNLLLPNTQNIGIKIRLPIGK